MNATRPTCQLDFVEVEGGFFDGLRLEFDPGLNCIAGLNGTGKTTLLRLMRFALGDASWTELEHSRNPTWEDIQWPRRGSGREHRVQVGVTAIDRKQYVFSRERDDEHPTVLDSSGREFEGRFLPGMFDWESYRTEVGKICLDPLGLVALIDRHTPPHRLHELESEIGSCESRLERGSTDCARLLSSHTELEEELNPARTARSVSAPQPKAAATLAELRERLQRLSQERSETLRELSARREARYVLRCAAAGLLNELHGPELRFSLTRAGEARGFEQRLSKLIGDIPGGKHCAAAIAATLTPQTFVASVAALDPGPLRHVSGVGPSNATRIVAKLHGTFELLQLETIECDDTAHLQLHLRGEYVPAADASGGEKTLAALRLILREAPHPLVLDCPDVGLSGEELAERVAPMVTRLSRQVILFSRSPILIPEVDPARLFLLRSDGRSGSLAARGTSDEVLAKVLVELDPGIELRADVYQRARGARG